MRTPVSRLVRWAAAVTTLLTLAAPTAAFAASANKKEPTPPASQPAQPGVQALVLYDTTGQWGSLGELYATEIANLVGHFGSYTAEPVAKYTAGQLAKYTATIYVGSTYDEPLPNAFLDDVLADQTKPVIWMYDNIWKLTGRSTSFTATYGWNWSGFDTSDVASVSYKGTALSRNLLNRGGIMNYSSVDTTKVQVLAEAKRADGSTLPWAVRSNNLTYIGENPFSYTSESDRTMIFSDLLFDALAPTTATRHRALVRLEDIGPDADPTELRAAADVLASEGVPFSFGVYPVYNDPNGANNNGVPETYSLKQRPKVVQAIQYMISKGGTPIMHGYTHQYSNVPNPYNGVSADDFEFFTAHVDAGDNVVMDGPVKEDSTAWANSRLDASAQAFTDAKLAVPSIFEFPHYAGSAVDYKAVAAKFATRYERSLYFNGVLSGGTVDSTSYVGQFFPYVVKDVYGSKVIPEDLGNYEPVPVNNHPARSAADMIATAKQNLVVRDGFASFFFHPYYDVSVLKTTVEGIKGLGYTFVAASSL